MAGATMASLNPSTSLQPLLLPPDRSSTLRSSLFASKAQLVSLNSPHKASLSQTRRRHKSSLSCGLRQGGRGGAPDVVKSLGGLLWGKGLPPGALVGIAKELWTTGWLTMMAQLAPSGGAGEASASAGEYRRPSSQFRNTPHAPVQEAERGRYHLYVALTCPWAHRTAMVHTLKGLAEAVPLSVAVPGPTGLWEFQPCTSPARDQLLATEDRANGLPRLADVYRSRKGGYDGRCTVPMLWDSREREVVNNESADIIQFLNSDFNQVATNPGLELAPSSLREDMERWNQDIYLNVNNGVYRCGFAQSQRAYEAAVESLFATLDKLERHLSTSRYLCGDTFTLADVRLFTTLYRFDPVYHILFKCSKQKLSEYSNLFAYMRDIYQLPGVASTCDLEAIMDGYYKVLFPLNPGGIRPSIPRDAAMPTLWSAHHRESLGQAVKSS